MIGFVICGPEHSGTTLVSDLFRQLPGVDAGFEAGVLLAATPRSFPELVVHAEITCWGWGIDPATLASCCDTDDFTVFYDRLAAASTILQPGTRMIFDKTPRYLTELAACMAKLAVPFVVVFKDPRAIVCSDWRKAGTPPFGAWFEAYAAPKLGWLRLHYAGYRHALGLDAARVCLVRMEDLCLDTRCTCERMYALIGQDFSPAYMRLSNVRYENTRGTAVNASIPFDYLNHLDAASQRRITETFAELADWFYD